MPVLYVAASGRSGSTLVDRTMGGVDGLGYEEAAEELGVPLGTLKSRLYRARRRVRQQLTAYGKERGYGQRQE